MKLTATIAPPQHSRRRLPRKPCPMENCWEITPGGRLCNACSSWSYRIQRMDKEHLVEYSHRLERFAGRAHQLSSKRRFGKKRKAA